MAWRQAEPLVELQDPEPAEERGLDGPRLGEAPVGARRAGPGHGPQEQGGLPADGRRDSRGGAPAHLLVISRHIDAHEGTPLGGWRGILYRLDGHGPGEAAPRCPKVRGTRSSWSRTSTSPTRRASPWPHGARRGPG